MSFLLDTHVFLWWLADNSKLSSKARTIIENENNLIFVSIASIWEIIIKKSLGKLKTPDNLEKIIPENDFKELFITLKHVLALQQLPNYHHDPFDRMLLAQAKSESLTIITADEKLTTYDVHYIKV